MFESFQKAHSKSDKRRIIETYLFPALTAANAEFTAQLLHDELKETIASLNFAPDDTGHIKGHVGLGPLAFAPRTLSEVNTMAREASAFAAASVTTVRDIKTRNVPTAPGTSSELIALVERMLTFFSILLGMGYNRSPILQPLTRLRDTLRRHTLQYAATGGGEATFKAKITPWVLFHLNKQCHSFFTTRADELALDCQDQARLPHFDITYIINLLEQQQLPTTSIPIPPKFFAPKTTAPGPAPGPAPAPEPTPPPALQQASNADFDPELRQVLNNWRTQHTQRRRKRGEPWPYKIARQIEAYRREDPPPKSKLAIPVSVLHHLQRLRSIASQEKQRTTCDLCIIAFFYLLRVGEYTYTKPSQRKRTVPFRVRDITFWHHHTILPHSCSLEDLQQHCTSATLAIENQKNGQRNTVVNHDITGLSICAGQALIRRIKHITSHTPDPNAHIATYFDQNRAQLWVLPPTSINTTLKQAVTELLLHPHGITADQVSSHSLRAGGATALHLNGVDAKTIQILGRWSSDTFLTYIHNQLSAFSHGLSTRMSTDIPFHNTLINTTTGVIHQP